MSKKATIGTILALLLIGGVTWPMLRDGQSPEMREVGQLQEKLFSEEARNSMTPQQQAAAFKELKEKAKTLSKEEQARLGKEYHEQVMKQKLEYLDRFFSLKAKKERDAFLDKAIDREHAFAKQKRELKGDAKAKGGTKNGRAKGGIGTAEDMRNGLRRFLDSTSADQRARFNAYRDALETRRKERGLK